MSDLDGRAVRNVSVRLPEATFDAVVSVARVDGITMGEVIRRAIADYAAARKKSPDWTAKVQQLQQQLELLLPPDLPAERTVSNR